MQPPSIGEWGGHSYRGTARARGKLACCSDPQTSAWASSSTARVRFVNFALRLLRKIVIFRSDFDLSTGCGYADRSAAEDSKYFCQRAQISWRTSRSRIAPWSSGRRTAERSAQRGLGVVVVRANARRAPPPQSAEARPDQHCDQWAAGGSKDLDQRVKNSWHSSCARIVPWSSGRRITEHPPSSAELAWFCCGPTCGALHPDAVGRDSTAPTLRQVSSTAFERSWLQRLNPAARGSREFRPVENRPTAGEARAAQRGLGVVVIWANACCAPPHAVSRGSTAQYRDRLVVDDSQDLGQRV